MGSEMCIRDRLEDVKRLLSELREAWVEVAKKTGGKLNQNGGTGVNIAG